MLHCHPVPVLELWHLAAAAETWANIQQCLDRWAKYGIRRIRIKQRTLHLLCKINIHIHNDFIFSCLRIFFLIFCHLFVILLNILTLYTPSVQRLVINDVSLTDEAVVEAVVACCLSVRSGSCPPMWRCHTVNPRTCELEAVGRSHPDLANTFWAVMTQRLQEADWALLDTMVLRQTCQ